MSKVMGNHNIVLTEMKYGSLMISLYADKKELLLDFLSSDRDLMGIMEQEILPKAKQLWIADDAEDAQPSDF